MSKEFFEKVFEGTIFIFLSGVIMILLSATNGISIGGFQVSITDIAGRLGIGVIGIILLGAGIVFQVKGYSRSNLGGSQSSSVSNVLTDWNKDEFRKKLQNAVDVRMMGVASYGLLSSSTKEFQEFLSKGGQLRCIYVKPDGKALKMVATRSVGVETELDHLKAQRLLTIEFLQSMAKNSAKGTIHVREIDYLHSSVLTLIDPMLPSGIAYVTVNGFGQIYTERPCLVISKAKNKKWFDFFLDTFENTWQSPESSNVL